MAIFNCKTCGAVLNYDESITVVKCDRCGNMQTLPKIIEKEPAVMTSTSGTNQLPLDKLLQNGHTYLNSGDYPCAKATYTSITKLYPEDYRGWWGLIMCETQKFKCFEKFGRFSFEQVHLTKINTWFRYIKKLAEPRVYEDLESTYIEYFRKVSSLLADEEIKYALEKISFCRDRNTYNEGEGISSIYRRITSETERINKILHADDEDINRCEKLIAEAQDFLYKGHRKAVRGAIIFALGIISIIMGFIEASLGFFDFDIGKFFRYILLGIIIGFIGFMHLVMAYVGINNKNNVLRYDLRSKAEREKQIAWLSNAINETKSKDLDLQEQLKKDVNQLYAEIDRLNDEIAKNNTCIDKCNEYIALGKDKITELCFSNMCKDIGVDMACDNVIVEYRKAIFDIQ